MYRVQGPTLFCTVLAPLHRRWGTSVDLVGYWGLPREGTSGGAEPGGLGTEEVTDRGDWTLPEEPVHRPLLERQTVSPLLPATQGVVRGLRVVVVVLLHLVAGVDPVEVQKLPETHLLLTVRSRDLPDGSHSSVVNVRSP